LFISLTGLIFTSLTGLTVYFIDSIDCLLLWEDWLFTSLTAQLQWLDWLFTSLPGLLFIHFITSLIGLLHLTGLFIIHTNGLLACWLHLLDFFLFSSWSELLVHFIIQGLKRREGILLLISCVYREHCPETNKNVFCGKHFTHACAHTQAHACAHTTQTHTHMVHMHVEETLW